MTTTTLLRTAPALLLFLPACASPARSSRPERSAPRLILPAELELQRAGYEADIGGALERVARWFSEQGLAAPPEPLVREVVVLGGGAEARRAVAARFGISESQVPEGFSGTIDGDTLLLVSREAYAATFRKLYPEEPWTDGEYRRLAAHELAHRAHELAAISLTGSADGMGPRWFFESLALACAGQFQASAPGLLSFAEVSALIAEDERRPLGYPRYADMFRSVAKLAPVKELVARAGAADFLELLRSTDANRISDPRG